MLDGDGMQFGSVERPLPSIPERLIVALDVDGVENAREVVEQLDGVVSFFKIGLWLFVQRGVNQLIDDIIASGKRVFLDYKMFDIGETVRRGVESAVERKISFVTVHGDPEIMKEAVKGRGDSSLKIFGISVLTSIDDESLKAMGYDKSVKELIDLRVRSAVECGCDGIIASAADNPDQIRELLDANHFLIATPGIRSSNASQDDHKRSATPQIAIENGADYLVVGRPIVRALNRREAALEIIAEMEIGWQNRLNAAQRSQPPAHS